MLLRLSGPSDKSNDVPGAVALRRLQYGTPAATARRAELRLEHCAAGKNLC